MSPEIGAWEAASFEVGMTINGGRMKWGKPCAGLFYLKIIIVEGGVSSAELLQTKNTFALKHFRFSIVWLFSDYNALDFCSPSEENEKLMPTLFLSEHCPTNKWCNDFQPQSNQPTNFKSETKHKLSGCKFQIPQTVLT